jgi:hypothetical protein
MIISRTISWERVTLTGEMRNAYRTLVGKPEGWRSFGRPKLRWGDNIKENLKEGGLKGVD